jgi:hypothetical protein
MERILRPRTRLREIDQECQARLARLEAVIQEAERLRIALQQAEAEISEVWESDLPRHNKMLLVQLLRSHCRQMENSLARLLTEAAAAAPPPRLSYRRRRE